MRATDHKILDAVSWETSLQSSVLFASAALAVWAFVVVRSRRSAPGREPLGGLALGVALWCLTSGLHTLVASTPTRIALAQIQYIGISAVPPLWLLFASEYARLRWLADPVLRIALWIVPVATMLAAFTNPLHGLLWTDVVPVGARLRYVHGPWFWVAVSFNYAAMAGGTIALARALRQWPLPHRRQLALVLAGAALPWIGNVLYLLRLLPDGFDPTPVAFALSGSCILWGLYYHRLLTLVPIARDLVIERMDAGVFVLDGQRRIVDVNPAAMRLIGCSDECLGQSIDHAVPWWTHAAASERVTAGVPAVIAVGPRSLDVQMTAVHDAQDVFVGWLVVLRDITATRAAEAERHALERRMLEQQRVESLSVLAAGVAHDFNNLLTSILGNADLVSIEAMPGSAVHANAQAIIIGAQRAADLVDKMLAYAGEGRGAPQPVDLHALVLEMSGLLQASIGRRCTIEYEGASALPQVSADPRQLGQVLLNLVANAAEASPDGSIITITTGVEDLWQAALDRLTFGNGATPGRHVFLDVADTGAGIDPATLRRAFDPFFSTKAHRRGLGLAAVQGIVRSHGGALRIDSTLGRGTRVRIWLHVIDVDAATERSSTEVGRTVAPPSASDRPPTPRTS